MDSAARITAILERFRQSTEGRCMEEQIREMLEGRTVLRVEFLSEDDGVTTVLHLDNGAQYRVFDREQTLEALEARYEPQFRALWAEAEE